MGADATGRRGSPAVLVYLQISGLGPMLGSGFWLIASERFDPRTAKQRFGQIAGVGTLGGLARRADRRARGGRVRRRPRCCRCSPCSTCSAPGRFAGSPARRRRRRHVRSTSHRRDLAAASPQSGSPRARAGAVPAQSRGAGPARHDRRRAGRLRLQGAGGRGASAAATACSASSPSITPATSLVTFVVQTRRAASRSNGSACGDASTPSLALIVGGLGGLFVPGLWQRDRRARRRIGVPRLAVPHRLRAVLHADSGRRKARRQVDHRRRLRSPRRCRRRRHDPAAAVPAARSRRSTRDPARRAIGVLGGRGRRRAAG